MKRCPECRRDYYDESMMYCLDDGTALLEGPASGDEPVTAIYGSPSSDSLRGPSGADPWRGPSGADPLRGPSSGESFRSIQDTAILPATTTGEIFPQTKDRRKQFIAG